MEPGPSTAPAGGPEISGLLRPVPSQAIITRSPRMRAILNQLGTIAASDGTVLLIGETGVGKELLADIIHRLSPRGDRPVVKIALAAIPHELLESELFGHERGAFTHAVGLKRGLFELAHRGSLFLDDIDDVPASIQAKLLRVIESREVLRVGGETPVPVDVRLMAASKVDLRELVARGLFRPDLFYRINVIPVEIPPLRERREDVPVLVEQFLKHFAADRAVAVAPEAMEAFQAYDWPGNVRELRNVLQRVALFAQEEIRLDHLPPELRRDGPVPNLVKACTQCLFEGAMSFQDVVACLEVNLLREALGKTKGNRSVAARMLGLSLSTLRDKLKKHGIEGPADRGDPQSS